MQTDTDRFDATINALLLALLKTSPEPSDGLAALAYVLAFSAKQLEMPKSQLEDCIAHTIDTIYRLPADLPRFNDHADLI